MWKESGKLASLSHWTELKVFTALLLSKMLSQNLRAGHVVQWRRLPMKKAPGWGLSTAINQESSWLATLCRSVSKPAHLIVLSLSFTTGTFPWPLSQSSVSFSWRQLFHASWPRLLPSLLPAPPVLPWEYWGNRGPVVCIWLLSWALVGGTSVIRPAQLATLCISLVYNYF